jgi:purine-nucleoside phosphorylase
MSERNTSSGIARLGVILGSGLGGACEGFPVEAETPFDTVEGLSSPGVEGHRGVIRRCLVDGAECLFVQGRKHFYEGRPDEIRTLVEHVHRMGVRRLIVTSAAGSLDKHLEPGGLVLVEGVIDFQVRRFAGVWGQAARQAGSRHGGAGRTCGRPAGQRGLALDGAMGGVLCTAARDSGIALGRGVLACLPGPVYETPSEIRALQLAGTSLVSMSGAPEIQFASELGISVAMIALVTNWAAGISPAPLAHDEVLAAAAPATAALRRLIRRSVCNISN